jgi:hypothetical protein
MFKNMTDSELRGIARGSFGLIYVYQSLSERDDNNYEGACEELKRRGYTVRACINTKRKRLVIEKKTRGGK